MIFRYSRTKDKAEIEKLLIDCFGDTYIIKGGLKNLDKRYLLAVDSDYKIVGLTGIRDKSVSRYDGYDVDWTCVLHEYRGQGIAQRLLKKALSYIPYGSTVYCNCWRLKEDGNANLHNTIIPLGFKLVKRNRENYDVKYDRHCQNCCERFGENCHCYFDLYRFVKEEECV